MLIQTLVDVQIFNLLQFCRHYQSVLSSFVMMTSAILFGFISYGNKEGDVVLFLNLLKARLTVVDLYITLQLLSVT